MDIDKAAQRMLQKAPPRGVIGAAVGLLVIVYAIPPWLNRYYNQERKLQNSLSQELDRAQSARERFNSRQGLKSMDLEQLKSGLGGHAQSEKTLFEAGISLQEERRLLEKQLEIMTTSLLINPSLQRVFLMRGEQPLQSYLINYLPLRSFGGARTGLPNTVRVISKERFAHPERGKSEEVNGTLQYVPPQVGTSVRSNALGEYVLFTNSPLILHGPPLNADDHERFPHVCLGLDQEAARKLYRGSFVGTRINLRNVVIEKSQPPEPLAPSPAAALTH